ncbi:DUF6801 domain-containing protein [Saccharothrix sp. NRRL B-16348]|uniref:DUF6801 domain-containing protein n=1 Tax=Saccharothrix sp. NRRL B-16348 TaxID=1415542 RepID=UPI0007C86193|nr:DUF6801 domain-containing protein [Saccharothrix sp. NRRL B-16348]
MRLRTTLGAGVTSGLVVAGLLAGVGTGSAAPVQVDKTLTFTCPFPLIGNQVPATRIRATIDAPTSVGGELTTTDFSATVTVPPTATQGLTLVGAATVEGSAEAGVTLDNAGSKLDIKIPGLTVPKTPVPAEGAFDVVASGPVPTAVIPKAGTTTVTVGDYSTTLTPKKADGTDTGLGTFTSHCVLDPGQDPTLIRFDVAGGGGPTTTTTTTSTTTTTTTRPTTTTTTPPGGIKYAYSLEGTSTIKKLGGSVALGPGSLNADLDLATGNFTGDLVLPPTSGKFSLFGFVPVESKIEFAPEGKTTGTLTAGAVKSTSKVTIKLPSVTAFGIPISNDPNCRTTTPADIGLASAAGFDPLKGGKPAGTYTIPPLTGCGPLNDVVSGFAAGPDNTIDLALTAKTA